MSHEAMSSHYSELARLEVSDTAGVFAARQLGRGLAAVLALERQDQIRVATALSEISRSAVTAGRTAVVTFGIDDAALLLTVTMDGEPPADGIAAAGRLMDRVAADGRVVRMTKRRPPGVRPDPRLVGEQVAAVQPRSALDELQRQNQDLISALDDLKQQKDQLLLLNAELQETNRGVMALYSELSDELEQTNRGVVALYAELDEKSERLRAASESKDRFWANVSHELRTPLNSIIGLTRLLAEPPPGGTALDPERLYQVELIANSGGTLLTLVNDLLDVAKAESGQLHVDPAQVDLPALFGRLRGLARPMAEGKPVEVIVSADGDPNTPVTILTDEVALTSILRNLLSNGIKYTDHGEVRLSVRVAGPRLEISVADTGIGIPAGLHAHVFEEFYQVPGRRRGGTGLGLPYARRLAAILGGDLTLTSEPGAGTTVVLGLPLQTPAVGTVLLADDDATFRGVLRGLLDGLADRVLEAGNGREALALLAAEPADLVLADMRMPGMDGSALLARLPAGVPAIIVTGADVPPPPRAAAVLRKDELTRERLEFTLRGVIRAPS
ncbi:MAG TPA: ATP-binding protein [Streptosporangiaceae bacterium]|nr:ATP-binding protein [Streptosporangiaceae bacterium]